MTNLMTHQKVIDDARGTIPEGKGENPTLNIKGCCIDSTILNDQIFGRKEFGELTLDLCVDGHWCCCVCSIIQENPRLHGGHRTLSKLALGNQIVIVKVLDTHFTNQRKKFILILILIRDRNMILFNFKHSTK